jgi:hypothetical protein
MARTRSIAVVLAALCLLLWAPGADADQMGWHSEAPVGALGLPAPIGSVGDLEFWAPNRGVLITAGIEGVTPAGVYAYDGVSWHLYSTVCGGEEGRIAWSGPDEFWTVSSYASHQAGAQAPGQEQGRTLCRFREGKVIESFAEPFGEPTAYQQMDAAACAGPEDCWFAGLPLEASSPNAGPFHLHWNGSALETVPSLTEPQPQIENPPGTITGLDFLGGALYESATEAPFVRRVDPTTPEVFSAVSLPEAATGPFDLAGDPGQLWAVGPVKTVTKKPSVLRNIGDGFEEVPLAEGPEFAVQSVASEPNGAAVWIGGTEFNSAFQTAASMRRVSASGTVSEPVILPGPGEELDGEGGARVIACPATEQCWMVTETGWLFHLGGPLPQDTDPAMHVLITFRPEDASSRKFVPPGLPEDNSGEKEAARSKGVEAAAPFPETRHRKNIVYGVHQKIVGKRTLELSFKLRARAHVQLRARFHGKVVAKTARLTLGKGPHQLHLKLDPARWPTGLDFKVHPAKKPKK